ncbi:T6SS effector amidase Tae4 family protein [Helicobacter sp. T3_23-1056]
MGYIVTATCNGVSASMEVQRPSLSRLEKQYTYISLAEETFEEDLSKQKILRDKFYQELYNYGKKHNLLQNPKFARQLKEEPEEMNYIGARYALVGGNLLYNYIEYKERYKDTCAMRVCYALNKSPVPIKSMKKMVDGKPYWLGSDNHRYYTSVDDIITLLNDNWGKTQEFSTLKDDLAKGKSEDILIKNNDKQREYLAEFEALNIKGIVAMKGIRPNGATYRHTTLWKGNSFLDNELKPTKLIEQEKIIFSEFHFWQTDPKCSIK